MTGIAPKSSRGGCPRCGKTIPFGRAMVNRGRTFECAECGSLLVVPKAATSLAILAFVLLSFLSKRVPLAAVAIIVVAGLLVEWLLAKVRLAEAAEGPAR